MSERMSEKDVISLLRVLDRHQGGVEVLGSDALADAIDECIITITKLRAELAKAERERDGAREEARKADAALSPLDAVVHHLGIEDSFTDPVEAIKQIERERDSARADALEEAAKVCETLTGSDATPTLRPGARMCLHRIRALKPTTTLGEQ